MDLSAPIYSSVSSQLTLVSTASTDHFLRKVTEQYPPRKSLTDQCVNWWSLFPYVMTDDDTRRTCRSCSVLIPLTTGSVFLENIDFSKDLGRFYAILFMIFRCSSRLEYLLWSAIREKVSRLWAIKENFFLNILLGRTSTKWTKIAPLTSQAYRKEFSGEGNGKGKR